MANQVYISAGLSVKKSSGDSSTENQVYISAGLSPQKVSGGSLLPINVTGSLPAMAGVLTQKKAYHRALEGSI